ncbi:hypothetical protein ACFRMQ_19890 [Kitasatospora sp. NPDC056783]|uniref:hypothetical protein n=1 Tax=Kitasatospora sp. NPDC056783 TaxID=3345943 RepID=UPI003684950A
MSLPIRDARVHASILNIVARHQHQNKGVAALATAVAACVVKGATAGALGQNANLVITVIVLIIIGFTPHAVGGRTEMSQSGGGPSALSRRRQPHRFTSRHHQ